VSSEFQGGKDPFQCRKDVNRGEEIKLLGLGTELVQHTFFTNRLPSIQHALTGQVALDARIQSFVELWPGEYVIYDDAMGERVSTGSRVTPRFF
jgi:hypothetical protein